MRRPLILIAIALLLLGVEVATGAISLVAVRLWLGLNAVVSGDEFLVSTPRFVIGFAILLTGVGVLGAVLWAEAVEHRILHGGSACPQCGTPTKRVKRRKRHRILSRILETDVTRRHCGRCGWSGLAA